MAGDKLTKILLPYLGLPYWRNIVSSDGVIIEEGPFGGKGTLIDIAYATSCALFEEGTQKQQLSTFELQKKYNIGLECSGLVYNILNDLSKELGMPGIYYKMEGNWRGVKRLGSRAVSASHMSQSVNSTPVVGVANIKPGDLLILMGKDSIGHIMIVVKIDKDIITILHTSSESAYPFAHTFNIKVSNIDKDIFRQEWEEKTSTGQDFRNAFELTDKITGVYRPNFLCQI